MNLLFTCSDNIKYTENWLGYISRRPHYLLSLFRPPGTPHGWSYQLVLPHILGFRCHWAPSGLQKSIYPCLVDSVSHSPAATSILSLILKTQHLPHPGVWWPHFLFSWEAWVAHWECLQLPACRHQNVSVSTLAISSFSPVLRKDIYLLSSKVPPLLQSHPFCNFLQTWSINHSF